MPGSDGRYLLAAGRGPGIKMGGAKAWLVDFTRGAPVRQWSDPRLENAALLSFTPKGLLFSGQGANFVLDTPVNLPPTAVGDGFLADRESSDTGKARTG